MQLYDLKETKERVILVGVQADDNEDTEKSLDELEELAQTAGAETVGRIIQNREQIHPGTYVGKGKLDEIKNLLWETDATGIICDDELSPAQLGNLQDALDTKVMDRTLIILDIFAERASTNEGKNSGGTCTAEIPPIPPGWSWEITFQTRRRNRYKRSRREKT